MRIVEEKMLEAIKAGKEFHSGNTNVEIGASGTIYVMLFGNCICKIIDGVKKFSNCGYKTNTTRSRLNALGCPVYQKNWEWYNPDGTLFTNDF